MNQGVQRNPISQSELTLKASEPIVIEADKVENSVLKRLIEEVRFDNENRVTAYNRTHNRHNRGR